MAHFALGVAIAFACFGFGIDAKPLEHSRGLGGRRSLNQRDETPAYSPIAPSVLADVESRPSTTSQSVGDYVANGLGAEMDLVSQEYGLRNSESFYWGLDGMPLANLTAFADGEDVRVLSVERFAGVLDSAQCSNASVQLTFTQEADFQDVLSAWTWINDADENYVVLVTETSQCNAADGDNTDRQPWHVTHATFDDTANTVSLDAEPKTWDQAFGSWHLIVDSRGLLPVQEDRRRHILESRDFPSLTGSGTNSTSISLDQSLDGLAFQLNNGGRVTCTSCSTYGALDFVFDASYDARNLLSPKASGSVTTFPVGVGSSWDLDIDLKQGPASFPDLGRPRLLSIPRAANIKIAGVIELGPELSLGIGGGLTVENDVLISTGVTVDIPDDSQAGIAFTLEKSDPSLTSNHSSWIPTYTAHDTQISDFVNVTGSVGPQLILGFKVGILGISDLSNFGGHIGLELTAPELILDVEVFDKDTAAAVACPAPVNGEGVRFELDLGLDFDGYEYFDAFLATPGATQTIFATQTPLTSTCIVSAEATKNGPQGPVITTYPLPTGTNGTIAPGYAPYGSAPCAVHGELICNGENYFALCNWGTAIWQPVAGGTACENGAIVGTGIYAIPPVYPSDSVSATCSINGQLLCNGDSQFGLCNWGRVVWQPVAAGTQCQSGQIVRRGVYASPTPTPMLGLIRGR